MEEHPTYDSAVPVVDSLESITHALRITEYADRNDQYQWFLDTLEMRQVHIWDFARNFISAPSYQSEELPITSKL